MGHEKEGKIRVKFQFWTNSLKSPCNLWVLCALLYVLCNSICVDRKSMHIENEYVNRSTYIEFDVRMKSNVSEKKNSTQIEITYIGKYVYQGSTVSWLWVLRQETVMMLKVECCTSIVGDCEIRVLKYVQRRIIRVHNASTINESCQNEVIW